MAKLSSFRTNSQAIKDGEWVSPGEEYGDLQILTRGFVDAYFDAQAKRQRWAARNDGGDLARIPNAIRRAINTDCLIDHVVLDVRGLTQDDGTTLVTIADFREFLRDDDYADLVVACFNAASMVGKRRAATVEAVVGN